MIARIPFGSLFAPRVVPFENESGVFQSRRPLSQTTSRHEFR